MDAGNVPQRHRPGALAVIGTTQPRPPTPTPTPTPTPNADDAPTPTPTPHAHATPTPTACRPDGLISAVPNVPYCKVYTRMAAKLSNGLTGASSATLPAGARASMEPNVSGE